MALLTFFMQYIAPTFASSLNGEEIKNKIETMKSVILSTTFVLLSITFLFAQENKKIELSLQGCVQAAVEKNINVQTARIDHEKSGYKVSETRAALLPKININGNFQDNISLPTTIIPGEIFGQPGTNMAVKLGAIYNTNASIGINQVLYNQTALTALQISKKMEGLNALGVEKASEELALEVSKLYFLSLTTSKQKKLVEENIVRTKHLSEIIKLLVDNGMNKQVDYDRITVNLENLYTQLSNIEATFEQQLNMIKYTLDIPLEETVVLTDTAEMPLLLKSPETISDFSNHINIQMLESQKEINRLNQKMIMNGYLPSLSFTGQYAYQGLRQNFSNYFQSNPENKWYASSSIGLNLTIPIFDGLEKRSKSRQAKLDYQKTIMTIENTKENFSVNYQNAINNYQNHKNNVQRQKQNIALAGKVYNQSALKYREGLVTMSDLLQDEMGLNNAQASYLSALYNFKEAELKIMSLDGEIKNLINK
jgi:outer membrane protein TolC